MRLDGALIPRRRASGRFGPGRRGRTEHRLLSSAALVAALSGCASGGTGLVFPDVSARAAAEAARQELELLHPRLPDDPSGPVLQQMGNAGLPPLPWPEAAWDIVLLDSAEEAAFLFADGSLYLTRGLLPALGGPDGLDALFDAASALYVSGAFRARSGGQLASQPLPLPIPDAPPSPPVTAPGGASGAGDAVASPAPLPRERREAWLTLLDGLRYGHSPEFGAAIGRQLRLPLADLRLTLPAGMRFGVRGRGRFAAFPAGAGAPPALEVRTRPAAEGDDEPTPTPAAERTLLRALAAALAESAEAAGSVLHTVEAIRVRGFTGVRGRWRGDPPTEAADAPSAGLAAILATPGPRVEFRLPCGDRPFGECEAEFLAVLQTAERMFAPPLPGWRRLAAAPVAEAGPVRLLLEERAGAADAPLATLLELNRAWLDDRVEPGDRVLLVLREGGDGS